MSDSNPQPPVDEKKAKLEPPPDDDIDIDAIPVMSAEAIDALLQQEVPDFFKSVSAIGTDKSLSLEQIIIDDADAALNAEQDWWKEQTGVLKLIYTMAPFAPRASLQLYHFKFKISAFFHKGWIHFKHFMFYLATTGRKKAVAIAKRGAHQASTKASTSITSFKKLTTKAKLILLTSIVLAALGGWIIYRSATHGLLPADKEMFVRNLSEHATQSYDYDSKENRALPR